MKYLVFLLCLPFPLAAAIFGWRARWVFYRAALSNLFAFLSSKVNPADFPKTWVDNKRADIAFWLIQNAMWQWLRVRREIPHPIKNRLPRVFTKRKVER